MSRRGPRPPKARYELRAFYRGKRGGVRRIRTGTQWSNDAHTMAVELWRLARTPGTHDMRYDVVDHESGRGHLAPVVSYDELVRRAGSQLAAV